MHSAVARKHLRIGARLAALVALAALATLALTAGCAHRATQPPAAPPAPRPVRTQAPASVAPVRARAIPGYVARRDSLPLPDSLLLAGKRVVIDPGHGGFFKGCLGVNGTTEAAVNLGVSLRLAALLRAHGAGVLLTRERDRDFLVPADSSLKNDLAERARLANAFAPDLFVSVHHNADPQGAHDVNETQTYYQLGDEGPSYDAGTDVFRSLVRNLGIEPFKLLPGNFSVVRNSVAPALLTEASYLTNPDVEARVGTPEGQQLEAEAIFLGIARFFARRAPVVESFALDPADTSGGAAACATGRPRFRARIAGAFDAVSLRIDGEETVPSVTGADVLAQPRNALGGGEHEAVLSVRLAGEGAARAQRLRFTVRKRIERIELSAWHAGEWNGADPLALRVTLRDADGLPVPDSTLVLVSVERLHGVAPVETTVVARDGVAWTHLRATRALRPDVLRPRVELAEPARAPGALRVARTILLDPRVASRSRAGYALRMGAGTPLVNAPGTTGTRPTLDWLARDGFAELPLNAAGLTQAPSLPGYRTWGRAESWPPRYVAIAEGALQGRRIVLDPEGGGDDAAGMGPSGTRAATLNLDVARALAGMLRAAGADVALTREGDAAVSELQRVQVSEGFRADRFLRIGHAAAPPVAGHYFSSIGGRRWGARVAQAARDLGLADTLAVAESARYALSQVSATALYASLARVDSATSEARLLAPGALRAEAYALFVALARDYAPEAAWMLEDAVLHRADGTPAAGALVTLGSALVLQADAAGRVRWLRSEAGPLELSAAESARRWHELLVDSSHGRVLTETR